MSIGPACGISVLSVSLRFYPEGRRNLLSFDNKHFDISTYQLCSLSSFMAHSPGLRLSRFLCFWQKSHQRAMRSEKARANSSNDPTASPPTILLMPETVCSPASAWARSWMSGSMVPTVASSALQAQVLKLELCHEGHRYLLSTGEKRSLHFLSVAEYVRTACSATLRKPL